MKRLYALSCILVLITALAGCHQEEKIKPGTPLPPPQTQMEPQQKLKQDIQQLVSQSPANLKIQRQNGGIYKAAPYFTKRTIEMLKRSRAVQDREGELKTYDLKLRFEGYEDICLNSQTGLFRFEGEDPTYSIDLWSEEYWKRYVLKEINGEILYSSFEKDVIAQHGGMDLDKDGTSDDVLLYYDGDIRLKVMDSDVPVLIGASQKAVSSLVSSNQYNCNLYIQENPAKNIYQFLVGITYEFTNKYGSTSWLSCYEYKNGEKELITGVVVQGGAPPSLLIRDLYCSAYAFTPDGLILKDSFFASDNNALKEAMY